MSERLLLPDGTDVAIDNRDEVVVTCHCGTAMQACCSRHVKLPDGRGEYVETSFRCDACDERCRSCG